MDEMVVLVYCCHDVLHAAAASGVLFSCLFRVRLSNHVCQEAVKHIDLSDRS
jgi:hypothetical protein